MHTGHRNDMSAWPDIRCQRGHETHETVTVDISIGGPTAYHDYTPIPERLARRFKMVIWDHKRYMTEGPYCPARDAVSETIRALGVWEPRETALALQVLSTAPPGSVALDMGAQLGWFSLLAASCGVQSYAVEADGWNLGALGQSMIANGWQDRWHRCGFRVTSESSAGLISGMVASGSQPIRFVKLDLEGAEDDAVRMLWPSIEAGNVDHMLMEVSPVFADYYPALLARIVKAGYRLYLLPPKRQPPHVLDSVPADLESFRLDSLPEAEMLETVASWHQEDVWLAREGATW